VVLTTHIWGFQKTKELTEKEDPPNSRKKRGRESMCWGGGCWGGGGDQGVDMGRGKEEKKKLLRLVRKKPISPVDLHA